MSKVLVVVDMQRDFVNGALGTKEAATIVPKVVEKINEFNGIICVTYDTHTEDYLNTQEGKNLPIVHCVEYSDGWVLTPPVYDALKERSDTKPWTSFRKSTFGSIELAYWLWKRMEDEEESIDEVIIVGLCTDICVISNAILIKTFLPEIKVTVDAACCAGVTPESHNKALSVMKMCQINIENWET